jgi:beta-galactosidase
LYKIGIVGTDRKAKRIGYNVIREKLKQGKNVVIPLGRAKSDFPLLFVVLPLFLAALIAFVINSRRKFREDATRALLRSYNFFSDIRDMRLLSGFHSYFMFVVNSATFALLVINVLYFLRSNIVLDKVVVALGSPAVSDAVAFLAWRPVEAFSIIFAFFIFLSLAIALTIKFFSIFLRGRFLFSSIFYTVVWAFMPINLLIPVELLLLKMLGLNVVNFWIYLFLAFYLIWLVMRLFKGVYVIFDIRPSTVYLYGAGLILFIFIAIAFYFQTTANAYDYLSNALAQMKFLM